MSRVLVTGATGFIGAATVRRLCADGHAVTALCRRAAPALPAGATAWQVDDLGQLPADADARLAGIDTIVHCAARAHQLHDTAADPLAAFRCVNVDATLALARRAAAAGVRRFVFLSSIGVNGSRSGPAPFRHNDAPHPNAPYAVSKWEAEQGLQALAAETGLNLVIVRPPMVYGADAPGNFALLLKLVRRGWPLPLGSLHAPRSFVALDNLVDLLAHMVARDAVPSGVYLAGDGPTVTTTDFIRAIGCALGRPPTLLPVPLPLLAALAALAGRSEQLRKLTVPLAVDIEATRARLDWSPPWTLAQAMARALGGVPPEPENIA